MTGPANEFCSKAHADLPEEVLAAIAKGAMPLSALRQLNGYSIADLARIAGVSEETIQNAEAGGELVLQEKVALAKSLGVSADLLDSLANGQSVHGRKAGAESSPQTDGREMTSELGRKEIDQSHLGERSNELGRKEIDMPDDHK